MRTLMIVAAAFSLAGCALGSTMTSSVSKRDGDATPVVYVFNDARPRRCPACPIHLPRHSCHHGVVRTPARTNHPGRE